MRNREGIHRAHRGLLAPEQVLGKPVYCRRLRALGDAHANHAGAQHQDVAALDVVGARGVVPDGHVHVLRVVGEEVAAKERLTTPRRRTHVVEAHTRTNDREGVARKVDVGNGIHQDGVLVSTACLHHVGKRGILNRGKVHLVCAHAGDGLLDKLAGVVYGLQTLAHGLAHTRPVNAALGHVVADERLARRGVCSQRLCHELIEVEHLDALIAKHLGKAVVLCLGCLQKRDVIKEEATDVVGREVEKLVTRPVEHDLAKLANLRANVETRCHRILRNAFVSISLPPKRYPMRAR